MVLLLANKSVNLVSLDTWKSRGLTSAGLSSLSRPAKLQELHLDWSSCKQLRGVVDQQYVAHHDVSNQHTNLSKLEYLLLSVNLVRLPQSLGSNLTITQLES